MIDFGIKPMGKVSEKFLEQYILSFANAAEFVRNLPYGRNANKYDLMTVFADRCGTCSTKHALLKQLAEENQFEGLKLMTGIFRMNSANTPRISGTLQRHGLDYIPEAHNYLKYGNIILDFTNRTSKPENFENDLITEIEITTDQIADFKVKYHQQYLKAWLKEQKIADLTLPELWEIREQCIADLSAVVYRN